MLASEGLLVALLGLDVRGDALTRCRASPAPSMSVKLGSSGIDGISGARGAAEGIGGVGGVGVGIRPGKMPLSG